LKTEDTEALNQPRTKPNTVDRLVRTARTFVHHYNSTQYCNTETVFFQYSSSSRQCFFQSSSRRTSHLRFGQVEVRGKLKTNDRNTGKHVQRSMTVQYVLAVSECVIVCKLQSFTTLISYGHYITLRYVSPTPNGLIWSLTIFCCDKE